jgi:hypothetical protein
MRIGYSLSSDQEGHSGFTGPTIDALAQEASTPAHANPASSRRSRRPSSQTAQLASMSAAARRLLKGAPPIAQPMISRTGVRVEAHRARAVLQATMKDQRLIGGE